MRERPLKIAPHPDRTARCKPAGRLWAPLLGAMAALTPIAAGPADAQYARRDAPYVVDLPPPEKRGCYFYRGREFCGSYCYWEVNGKRYCQRRERDAHSQAPIAEDIIIDTGPVLK